MFIHKNNKINIRYVNGNIVVRYYYNEATDPDQSEDFVEFTYWVPPTQEASEFKPWTYDELIAEYDAIMANSNGYMTKHRYEKEGEPVLTRNGNHELFSYILEPEKYSKTIFIQAGIHGNEMDCKQQLLRIVDILVNKTHLPEYSRLSSIRNDARLVIIPCVSPYGHEQSSMNIPFIYEDVEYLINPNRNYDYNQQWAIPQAGVGGYPEMTIEEVQHTRDVILNIGIENFDYAMDWHDGGSVEQHYWISYNVDSKVRPYVNAFVEYLISTHHIENPVIDYCKDDGTTGVAALYFAKSLGIPASVVEWIGGYLGYDFGIQQMTQSMEIRANMLLMGYEINMNKEVIKEKNKPYFEFNYPKAFSIAGLRYDDADERTIVTDKMIWDRWNNLHDKHPNLIRKSSSLGKNGSNTHDIYTYTFGNGAKKVLYVGGIMRYGGAHKIDEFAIYRIIEYLCDDTIVSSSRFLQDLRDNYTIVVLPCIDNVAANNANDKYNGINNMALSYKKWQIVDGKCQPTSDALTYHDIPIIKKLIDDNTDLKCIVSGGEILTGYAANSSEYTTEFECHIVIPKNQQENSMNDYVGYLTNVKNEYVVVEHTLGTTFGDYAFDNYGIPTYYIQLNVSKKYTELANDHLLTEKQYLHGTYEAGRRMSNIINFFLI